MRNPFLASLLCLSVIPSYSLASDLGVVGPTYEIAERDLIEVMKDKFRRMERTGELAKVQENYKKQVLDAVEKPKPVPGIKNTEPERPQLEPERTVAMPLSCVGNGHKGCVQFLKTSHSTDSCWL